MEKVPDKSKKLRDNLTAGQVPSSERLADRDFWDAETENLTNATERLSTEREAAKGVLATLKQQQDTLAMTMEIATAALDQAKYQNAALMGRGVSLEIASDTDPLTGLWNYVGFLKRAQVIAAGLSKNRRAGDSAERVGIFMCDLDHFKGLNDSEGHDAGDRALRQVSKAILGVVRAEDLVCRRGGDEFMVLVRNGDEDTLLKIGNKIRDSVKAIGNTSPAGAVTMSIGLVIMGGGESVEEVIARSDTAMYKAKQDGKDRISVLSRKDASKKGK